MTGVAVQAGSASPCAAEGTDPVVFELRQVRLLAELSGWQRVAWLDGQATLWGELGILLDGAGGAVEAGADEVSNSFAALARSMTKRLMECGEPVPENYVSMVDAMVARVSSPDVPVIDAARPLGRLIASAR